MRNIHFSEKRIYIILTALLWIYLWLRAILIPAAHDEVATFFYYVHRGEFFPFFSHWDTNNHYLNSALSWASWHLFGSSPVALRLPNLLFAPVFFFYCYKISTELRHPLLRWTFLLSLCFTHSFIEFFAISRGYGISMALLSGAIWYLINFVKSFKLRFIALCLLFMMLATYANLALINTFFLILFFILIYAILNEKLFAGMDRKVLSLLFFLGVIPLGFLGMILLRLKFNGNLWAGSANGLWNATVKTVIKMLTISDAPVFLYFVVVYFILACVLFFYFTIRGWKQKFFQSSSTVFFYLLTGNLVVILVLGHVFKINYPEDRIGLYLIPLFLGSLLFLIDQVNRKKKFNYLLLIAIPLLYLPAQFLVRFNVTYLSFYYDDNIPWRFYDKVYADLKPGTFPPTIGGYKGRHFCWSYLDFRHGGKLSDIYSSHYPGYESDFQIVDIKDNPGWLNLYDSVDYDKYSGRYLLKRKVPLKKVFNSGSGTISSKGEIHPDFFLFYETNVDSLVGKTLYLGYDMEIESGAKPFVAWIVATVSDKSGNILRYERIPLDWLRTEWKGSSVRFLNAIFLEELPPGSCKLSATVWNMQHAHFRVNKGKCAVYKVIPDWK
jgi:hypothetical protein